MKHLLIIAYQWTLSPGGEDIHLQREQKFIDTVSVDKEMTIAIIQNTVKPLFSAHIPESRFFALL